MTGRPSPRSLFHRDIGRVLWRRSGSVGIRGASTAVGAIFVLLIGRWIPLELAGSFFSAYALALVFSVVVQGGQTLAILRDESTTLIERVRSLVGRLLVPSVLALALAPAYGMGARLIGIEGGYFWLAIPPLAWAPIIGRHLIARGQIIRGTIVEVGIVPAVGILGLSAARSSGRHPDLTLVILLGAVAAAGVGLVMALWGVGISRAWSISRGIGWRRLFKDYAPNYPLATVSIGNILLQHGDIVLATLVLEPREVAVYALVSKVLRPVAVLLLGINADFIPKVAEQWRKRQSKQLIWRHYRTTSAVLFIVGSAFLVGVVVGGRSALVAINPDYAFGYTTLVVLGIGAALNVATGPIHALLQATGREAASARLTIGWGAFAMFAVLPFGAAFGLVGVAGAKSVGTIATNAVAVAVARRHLGSPPRRNSTAMTGT